MKIKTALFLICLPFSSFADIIKMDVTATITDITEYLGSISSSGRGEHNFHNNTLFEGMMITASYLYNTDVEKGSTLAGDPNSDIYRAISDIKIQLGSWSFSYDTDWPYSFAPNSYIIVRNDRPDEYFSDIFYASSQLFYNPSLDLGPGNEVASLKLLAYSKNEIGLSNTDIPTDLNINNFDHRSLRFFQATRHDSSETRRWLSVDSYINTLTFSNLSNAKQVPAPATIWMFAFGAIFLARRTRSTVCA